MAIAVVMLIAFYQLPQFQDFKFYKSIPSLLYLHCMLILPQKDKERTTEKNNLLLNILFMTAPLLHH